MPYSSEETLPARWNPECKEYHALCALLDIEGGKAWQGRGAVMSARICAIVWYETYKARLFPDWAIPTSKPENRTWEPNQGFSFRTRRKKRVLKENHIPNLHNPDAGKGKSTRGKITARKWAERWSI